MGADIRVINLPDSPWTECFRAEGIETMEKHPVKKFDREFIAFLRQYIISEKIDVIHLFNSKATINGLVAARGTKAKVALYRGYEGNIHWYDPSAYLKYLHPRVDMIFCIAGAVEDLIKRTIDPCKKALKDAGVNVNEIKDVVMVGGMSRMPKVLEEVKSFFGRDPHKGVNPDEVVALGAAIQGGVLKGDVKDVLLLDVTPLSLGIETLGGVFTRLIDRNTTIPTNKSQVFSTADDNQSAVTIRVFQGEREMAADNKLLGQFNLEGIPMAARGTPQIEVAFDIDANGIVSVSAKDKASGKEQKITIQSSSGLSDAEVEKMVKDAETYAATDKQRKEKIEVKNQADGAIYTIEKNLKEYGDKLAAEDKEKIEADIAELKPMLEDENADLEATKAKLEELNQSAMKIGEIMYKDQQANSPEANPEAEKDGNDGEKVVDAEFEEVKDEDKK